MATRRTIKYGNIPTGLPISNIAVLYLLLDKFKAPQWLWGACGVIVVVVLISAIYNIATEDNVDVIAELDRRK